MGFCIFDVVCITLMGLCIFDVVLVLASAAETKNK